MSPHEKKNRLEPPHLEDGGVLSSLATSEVSTPQPEEPKGQDEARKPVEVGSWSHLQGFSTISGAWPWDFLFHQQYDFDGLVTPVVQGSMAGQPLQKAGE